MKKATANFLAYEFTKARFAHSDYNLNEKTATEVASFIKKLSSELETNFDDFDESLLDRFQNLSK